MEAPLFNRKALMLPFNSSSIPESVSTDSAHAQMDCCLMERLFGSALFLRIRCIQSSFVSFGCTTYFSTCRLIRSRERFY
jgi:hypothetical protein